ncbi:response regulator transcription factor [Bacillus albus]|uniref:response regulator transcription factor n=1 Tax=Bacillus cereus group TaxID=86661 RepID=UPI001C10AC40|nr:response regulator transcription factor [Bacillus albus]MBU5220711.1 response regulator transcription factor [Bacillus albus]MCU4836759.1 response regulator transcription factor [Bacillus cereus]
MHTILVLENELAIRSFIVLNLQRAGFNVIEASTGEEALELFRTHQAIDIALLDIMLPGIDGFEVCKKIRKSNGKLGIIMLTARVQNQEKVQGLTLGADDYIEKPFSPMELIARIQSLLRRINFNFEDSDLIHSGPFVLNILQENLYNQGQLIELTPTEYMILYHLMINSSKTISRDQLLNQIWGEHFAGETKVVDVNIRRIRQKIESNPSEPQFLLTIWGKGYMWKGNER